MTYLDLINYFWQLDLEYNFSDKEVALYFYLLKTCNHARWKNPFGLSNAITIARFGWGKTSFDTAKNNLKKAGLIDFKPGDGRGNVYQYMIIFPEKVNEKGAQKHTLSVHLSDTLSSNLSEPKPATSKNIEVEEVKEKGKGGEASSPTPKTEEEKLAVLEKRKTAFGLTLQPFVEEYGRPMIADFYGYWTEPNKSKTKLKWEMEDTWDVKRRLNTWRKNNDRFDKVKPAASSQANSSTADDKFKALLNGTKQQ